VTEIVWMCRSHRQHDRVKLFTRLEVIVRGSGLGRHLWKIWLDGFRKNVKFRSGPKVCQYLEQIENGKWKSNSI